MALRFGRYAEPSFEAQDFKILCFGNLISHARFAWRFIPISFNLDASVFRPPWLDTLLVFCPCWTLHVALFQFQSDQKRFNLCRSCSAHSLIWESDFSCEIRMATPRVTTVCVSPYFFDIGCLRLPLSRFGFACPVGRLHVSRFF